MIKRFGAAALVAATLPTIAAAADGQGTVTLGYGTGHVSDGGGDLNETTLDFSGGLRLNNNMVVGLDAGWTRFGGDTDGNPKAANASLDLGYEVGSGLVLGGYLEYSWLGEDSFDTDTSLTSYGLSAGYQSGGVMVAAFLGQTVVGFDNAGNQTLNDFGLNAGYELSPDTQVTANYIRSWGDFAGKDDHVNYFDLGGNHMLSDDLGLFGGASFVSADKADVDINTWGIGGSYYLGNVTQIPATLSLELVRSNVSGDGDSAHLNMARFGFTVPLGTGGARVPLNSVASASQHPRHDALTGLLSSSGGF